MDKRIYEMDRDELIAFVKEAMAEYKKNNQIINTPTIYYTEKTLDKKTDNKEGEKDGIYTK